MRGTTVVRSLPSAVCCLLSVMFLIGMRAGDAEAIAARDTKIGTTFSKKQCEYLGLDWRETYGKVLEMGFDYMRLGAYWSEIERREGVYDFSQLDEQINKAGEKGIPVILTVGMKAPRWPEYYIPEWVTENGGVKPGGDVGKNAYLRRKVLEFIERAVDRYQDDRTVVMWQVENEPMNLFGGKSWHIGKDLLEKEIAVVRETDEKGRKILLTSATYPNIFLRMAQKASLRYDPAKECLALCDVIGLNVYPGIGQKILGISLYLDADKKSRAKYFNGLFSRIRPSGKEIWITELQAEPWEPVKLVYTGEKTPKTADPEDTLEYFREFRNEGIDTIFLWGAEYWVFRAERYGDLSWYGILEEMRREAEKP